MKIRRGFKLLIIYLNKLSDFLKNNEWGIILKMDSVMSSLESTNSWTELVFEWLSSSSGIGVRVGTKEFILTRDSKYYMTDPPKL